MRIEKKITDNKFLNIIEVKDPSMGCVRYQYAERKGVDSIAFICIDKKKNSFLLNNEATPPLGKFLVRAFGGSLDKSKDKIDIVIEEVLEECGFVVNRKKVKDIGKIFVSTQMNQYCYLYLVDITNAKNVPRQPENKTESLSEPVWRSKDEIMSGDDWKSIVIISKMSNG